MAKFAPDAVLDRPIDDVASSTRYTVLSGQPSNFAGIAALLLASTTVDAGDFTKSNGTVSGRRLTVAAQSGFNASATGQATHVALDDGTTLKYVTTLAEAQNVTEDNPLSLAAWDIEFEDPQ
ncbi:hypothetical protein [Jiangella alkaliphila]|uniref:Bacteriophage lambda head decoration protein D n=1 Tax=Jiangella alkaliphila TaxID=419479 RepID=A0A1H2IEQ6_9ACTN|nr:hypothetical protein [Jiangella alkaliphila]SDU42573.1 hypothetical protein SAMN04488563_1657 [Jiangella alkaliphila]